MAGIKWNLSPTRLFEWLGDIRRRQIEASVMRVAERQAILIEIWMKQNRKWTDRTGQARATLSAEVIDVTGRATIILLTHGVDYGVFLEMKPHLQIIGPTLDYWGPRLMRDMQIELAGGTWSG